MEERERFVRGTHIGTLGTVATGLVAFGLFGMRDWALGFAVGALVSLVSFQLIVASVSRLTAGAAPRGRGQRRWWVWSLVRLLGTGVLLFLAVSYLPVNPMGVALGLLAVQIGMGGYLLVRLSASGSGAVRTEDRKP